MPTMTDDDQIQLEKEYSNWALTGRLLKLSWRYKFRCIQIIVFQLIILTLGLTGLSFAGLGIDYLRSVVEPGVKQPDWPWGIDPPPDTPPMQVLLGIAGAILGFALIRAMLNYFYTMAVSKLVFRHIMADLRATVYEKLQTLSFRFFDQNASGAIINRVTGDVSKLRTFIDGVVIQSFIMLLSLGVYLVYMLNIHVTLTFACLATTPLLWFVSAIFSRSVRPEYVKNRELMDDLVLNFSERIQGINTIKGFALEEPTTKSFEDANEEVRRQRQDIFGKVTLFAPTIGMLTQINMIVLLGYGGYLVIQGELTIGTGIVVFAGLLQQFTAQISNIAGIVDSIQQSLTGARRVFEVLDAPPEVDSPESPVPLGEVKGAITFENVHFHYKEKDTVLHDVSFEVKPGELVAIAGATGSGKSALMSLIPRFYDPIEGRVLLDGHDLRDLDVDELRRNIGIVFQDTFLFSNSIAANIAFGHLNATPEQIVRAAQIASAEEFIDQLPDGYDTVLSESGTNLSGGQRQRLAIARALLLEPRILLLDDPTAALDPETEHEIMDAIKHAIEGRTVFIVAHRLSTLRRADKIIVLREGRIVQMGTHDELMAQPGPYHKAIRVQTIDKESMEILRSTA